MFYTNQVKSLLHISRKNKFKVFIGYDEREHEAAEVCRFSIITRLSKYVPVFFLKSSELQVFNRPKETTQSTDFTYTRFLVPHLSDYTGYSIFCDCDFLFLDDIIELFDSIDKTKAVSVVKHPRYIPNSASKMDDIPQHQMPRKNWASLMVFNNSHPDTRTLTPDYVNTVMPGRKLHTFDWLPDNQIGSLSMDWNVLDGYYELDNPRAIHYTDGGPWFKKYQDTYYSNFWKVEHDKYLESYANARKV